MSKAQKITDILLSYRLNILKLLSKIDNKIVKDIQDIPKERLLEFYPTITSIYYRELDGIYARGQQAKVRTSKGRKQ